MMVLADCWDQFGSIRRQMTEDRKRKAEKSGWKTEGGRQKSGKNLRKPETQKIYLPAGELNNRIITYNRKIVVYRTQINVSVFY